MKKRDRIDQEVAPRRQKGYWRREIRRDESNIPRRKRTSTSDVEGAKAKATGAEKKHVSGSEKDTGEEKITKGWGHGFISGK